MSELEANIRDDQVFRSDTYLKKYLRSFRQVYFFDAFHLRHGCGEKNNNKRLCDHWSAQKWICEVEKFIEASQIASLLSLNKDTVTSVVLVLVRSTMDKYLVPQTKRNKLTWVTSKKLDFSQAKLKKFSDAYVQSGFHKNKLAGIFDRPNQKLLRRFKEDAVIE